MGKKDRRAEKLSRLMDDATVMPVPNIESKPHILISKVRKYYLEYIINLLSKNYEKIYKLRSKNIHLPSAIWRCARFIEMNAARSCMVVDLYRKNILVKIKELKSNNKKSRLHKKLLEYLKSPPNTDKKTQTSFYLPSFKTCNCECTCKNIMQPNSENVENQAKLAVSSIPVIINNLVHTDNNNVVIPGNSININNLHAIKTLDINNIVYCNDEVEQNTETIINDAYEDQKKHTINEASYVQQTNNFTCDAKSPLIEVIPCDNKSLVEDQEPEDEVMLQMEQLFRTDSNGVEDDLFESTLFDNINNGDMQTEIHVNNECNKTSNPKPTAGIDSKINNSKENLDKRIAFLEASGALVVKTDDIKNKVEAKNPKRTNMWLCEAYFKKLRLYEKLDDIRDRNRQKHTRIKTKFLDLFGEDSDDDQLMSPLNETKEFERSCKERIAPWVVKTLTPHYSKGRIRGKNLFKNVAKHLLNLIYQCSRYPSQYEVCSFVVDFLKSHRHIRCDADFKSFSIANI